MASTPQKTEALYQKDGTLSTHKTTVSSISPLSSLPSETQALFKPPQDGTSYILTVPSTIFHAQGGGQPSDTGTITLSDSESKPSNPTFHIHQVRKTSPQILHLGTFTPSSPSNEQLAEIWPPSAPITQTLHLPTRLLHSRLHTAGHVLGLAIMSLVNTNSIPADLKETKASHHPGTSCVEFTGLIPSSTKEAIQAATDALVAQNLPILIHWWSKEEAEKRCGTEIPEGVGIEEDGEGVRVVEVDGVGSYPCGGTHVQRLGELGRVVVRSIRRAKGGSRVSYEVADN